MFAVVAGRELLVVDGAPTTHALPADATCLALDGTTPLVGTREGLYAGPPADLRRVLAGHVTSVAVGPDGRRWAGTEPSAVYRSPPGAPDEWTATAPLDDLSSSGSWAFPPRPDTHHVRWVAVDPTDPDRLYVAVEAGALLRTADAGETWRDRTADAPRDTHGIATHPARPGTAWAAAGDGVAVTRDGGDSWAFPERGLDRTYCWSVAVDPGDPDRLLLSAAPGPGAAHRRPADAALFRRAGGGPWTRVGRPTDPDATRPVLAAAGPGSCVAADDAGVARTDDWGETWARVADAPGEGAVAGVAAVAQASGRPGPDDGA